MHLINVKRDECHFLTSINVGNSKQNRKVKISILIFLFLSLIRTGVYSQAESIADSVAKIYLKDQPGSMIIGINDNGKESIFYYGETEKGNKKKPDANTIYEIGNITETFTCILFADLTIKGIMHIDDPLQKYLPVDVPSPVYQPLICKPVESFESPAYVNPEDITMRVRLTPYACSPDSTFKPQPILLCYLATHTSGMPDLPSNFYSRDKANPFVDYSTEDLYTFLRQFRPEKPIGFEYRHSDLGIAILGNVITRKLNLDYQQILNKTLLDTVNMNDTRVILSPEQQRRLLSGYNEKGNRAKNYSYNFFVPSGALHSTASDMMKFLSLNISKKKNYFVNLLDYTHNTRIQPGGVFSKDLEIGLGWKINPGNEESERIVWQSGLTGGFSSYIGFDEISHAGVIILSSVSKSTDQIGENILRELNKKNNSAEGKSIKQ